MKAPQFNQAVLYARFSDRPNAAECESVEQQLTMLRAWCEARGIAVRSEHFDKASSGADREREGLMDAVAACRRGDVLLVRDWERFARDRTFAGIVIDDLVKRGVAVRSVTEQGDMPDTTESRLLRNILLELAEYRRQITRAQTRRSMLSHQANGRRMSKEPPYGWRCDQASQPNASGLPSRMVHDDDEQAIISHIVAMRTGSANNGLRAIARQLNDQGLTCRGGRWWHITVKKILDREGVA